jgi:hypothetical protein
MRFYGIARRIVVDPQWNQSFMKAGYVDPDHLQFSGHRVAAVLYIKPQRMGGMISAQLRRGPGFRSPVERRVT